MRKHVAPLARAAAAAGIDALFIETHPDIDNAPCDGPSQISFEELDMTGFQLTGLLLLGGGIILVTFVVFGYLSDRFGRIPVMAVGAVGMVCLMFTVGLLVRTPG